MSKTKSLLLLIAIFLITLFALLNGHQIYAKTLTVLTYDAFTRDQGPGSKLKELFESQCQCRLKFVTAEDGAGILNKIRMEGKSSRADVVVGLDNSLLVDARNTGYFQLHHVDTTNLISRLNWRDTYFIPFDYGYFAFVYDNRNIKKPATSFKDLINSGATIIYQDPRTSVAGKGLMMWIKAAYGDGAEEIWSNLVPKTVTVTKTWWHSYSMFLQGASDYVLGFSTIPAYHKIAGQKSFIKAANFSEGHIRQIEVAGLTRFSKHPDLARQFLRFLLSKEAQQIIPVTNWMLPVVKGVRLPKVFSELISPETIHLSPDTVAQYRKQWISEWRSSVTR